MRNSKEIGAIVKSLRKEKGISLTELSEKLGLNKSTVSRYENGSRKIPMDDIAQFANILGVSPEFLLLEDDFEKSEDTLLAAHFDKEDLTEEEWIAVKSFIDHIKSNRKN